jgi:hypothetical protein
MRERCMYGSVRGARGNLRPYRDRPKRACALMTRNPGTPPMLACRPALRCRACAQRKFGKLHTG